MRKTIVEQKQTDRGRQCHFYECKSAVTERMVNSFCQQIRILFLKNVNNVIKINSNKSDWGKGCKAVKKIVRSSETGQRAKRRCTLPYTATQASISPFRINGKRKTFSIYSTSGISTRECVQTSIIVVTKSVVPSPEMLMREKR